ncbi:iron chelate uptake ABC transporter family permease subunit [Chryseobacterium pennipullorum]|uniref:Iron ABC transporter permease n=1 Tax=Chryseobacterium pennipullorum TaxID=2258963 RepID=A0A3D9B9I6_9FLAO|nr:iron chelate uptake ABC transporter family permease subunit [Chryseobacterium pennipullorum]REC50213.1 iron ABC transporter permease [Chryseobacterium pennipullorum]
MKQNKKIGGLCALAVISVLFYLFFGLRGDWSFSLELRSFKILAIALVACCIGYSSVAFQTITANRILTPSVMGFEAVYMLLQTILVFAFGEKMVTVVNSLQSFALSVVCMAAFSAVVYVVMYKRSGANIYLMVLVGLVFGMVMDSMSSFMQLIIDPNDFFILQGKMFASFNKINREILWYAAFLIIPVLAIGWRMNSKLDIISLGKENSVSLGVHYKKTVRYVLMLIAVMVSSSTALIGPVGFLGLLTANLTYVVLSTYKHKILIPGCCLVTFITIVLGQLITEQVFNLKTPLSTIINFVGGIYFMVLILKSEKL